MNNNFYDIQINNDKIETIINEKQILASIISNGISLEKTNTIVDKLYYKFYNLYNIVNASNNELLKVKGLNNKKIELLKNIPNT